MAVPNVAEATEKLPVTVPLVTAVPARAEAPLVVLEMLTVVWPFWLFDRLTLLRPVNVPPVTVLPVKVSAVGREIVGTPAAPSPFVTVTSFAVPVRVRLVKVSAAVCVRSPAVEFSAARAVRVASSA